MMLSAMLHQAFYEISFFFGLAIMRALCITNENTIKRKARGNFLQYLSAARS
jgi:hypothetical protein